MKLKLGILSLISLTFIIGCGPGGDTEGAVGEHGEETAKIEQPKGPHGGKLFEKDGFSIEVTIYEPEIPPQSRVYPYFNGKPLDPNEVTLVTELHRIDRVDTINYRKQDDYLQGDKIVEEPHSFDVRLAATFKGNNYRWEYSSYEGRTTLSPEAIQSAGIQTEKVGGAKIRTSTTLNGRIIPSQLTVANVSARFPGIVKAIRKLPGSKVEKGEILATIESNESLKVYDLTAPQSGEVLSLGTAVGESVQGGAPIFLVGDLSSVWIELSVPKRDYPSLRLGQAVLIDPAGSEGKAREGRLIHLSAVADPDSQSMLARAEVSNADRSLLPGLFVEAKVVIEERAVPVAIKKEALQTFRDWNVVFKKVGENFEIAILQLGEVDGHLIEVTEGLAPGTEYVTENSFVVKADVMKSGATHDH